MRDSVLQRKLARIIMMLAESEGITPEQALDVFYNSKTYNLLTNPTTGLQLMSDDYILEDLRNELEGNKTDESPLKYKELAQRSSWR